MRYRRRQPYPSPGAVQANPLDNAGAGSRWRTGRRPAVQEPTIRLPRLAHPCQDRAIGMGWHWLDVPADRRVYGAPGGHKRPVVPCWHRAYRMRITLTPAARSSILDAYLKRPIAASGSTGRATRHPAAGRGTEGMTREHRQRFICRGRCRQALEPLQEPGLSLFFVPQIRPRGSPSPVRL